MQLSSDQTMACIHHASVVVVLGAEAPVAAQDVVAPEDWGRFVADAAGDGEDGEGGFEGLYAAADGVVVEVLVAKDAFEVEVVDVVAELAWDCRERSWDDLRSHFDGGRVCRVID
jgi:hypothetical protein